MGCFREINGIWITERALHIDWVQNSTREPGNHLHDAVLLAEDGKGQGVAREI
jgi:hypothetical protein